MIAPDPIHVLPPRCLAAALLAVAAACAHSEEPAADPTGPVGVERYDVVGLYAKLYSVNDSLLCPVGGPCSTTLPAGSYVDSSRTPVRTCQLLIGPSVAALGADQRFRLDMELSESCPGDLVKVDAVIAGTYHSLNPAADRLDFAGSIVQGRQQAILGGDVTGAFPGPGRGPVPEFLHLVIGNISVGVRYRITLRM